MRDAARDPPHGERRGLDRAGLAPDDGGGRCAGAAHGAAGRRRLPPAAGTAAPRARAGAGGFRHPHRRAALRDARHGSRAPPCASVCGADGGARGGRPSLPIFGTARGWRAASPRRHGVPCGVVLPRLLVVRQPALPQRAPRGRGARGGRPCGGEAAPRPAHLGRCAGWRGSARRPSRPPAAGRRGLGRGRVHPAHRRSARKRRLVDPGLLLRRHRRAGAGTSRRSAPPLPGEPPGAARRHNVGSRTPVPLGGRQAAATRRRRRRRLRLRADLRPAGTGQVGADEHPRIGLLPGARAGAPATRRRHRHRAFLVRADLADPRGPAAGAAAGGGLVPAPHDRGTRHQPLRHPARLPRPAAGRARLPSRTCSA